MNELRLKDYIKYNPEIHNKRGMPYTSKDIELILSDMPLADLSVTLERPAKAIAEARKRFKKEMTYEK
ncbi:MAG: hypothetical protein ACRCXX_07175 [Cetobacterium sp.]|uniref:hypothetical protein n=1 Tax=Cetobacterium sp. TaxID=2071632 RepID=UPI003F2C66CB